MNPALIFPVFLIAVSVFGWNVFSRRVEHDVAEWEITQQQGRFFIFLYRCSSMVLAAVGVTLILLTLAGK